MKREKARKKEERIKGVRRGGDEKLKIKEDAFEYL
jgi:hypothetical protein